MDDLSFEAGQWLSWQEQASLPSGHLYTDTLRQGIKNVLGPAVLSEASSYAIFLFSALPLQWQASVLVIFCGAKWISHVHTTPPPPPHACFLGSLTDVEF